MSIERVLDSNKIADIKRLRNLKTKQGKQKYSQKRLGDIYHVDQKTICNYLRGEGMSDYEIYEQFCKGVSKKSLANTVYFHEKETNKKYKRIDALTKVEQIILDNYIKAQNRAM